MKSIFLIISWVSISLLALPSPGQAMRSKSDLDRDSDRCHRITEKIIRGSNENQTKEVFSQCMEMQGWPVDINKLVDEFAGAISIELDKITWQDITINIPQGFAQVSQQEYYLGPTVLRQILLAGNNHTYLNLIIQQNNQTIFNTMPYPVVHPYNTYAHGSEKKHNWASFFGKINSDWVMGIGAYYYQEDNRRITITITSMLPQPSNAPPENLQLARNQYQAIKTFSAKWQSWLSQQFPPEKQFQIKFQKILNFIY